MEDTLPYKDTEYKKAIELLKRLREIYLFGVDEEGEDLKTPLPELLKVWEEVNKLLNE